MITHDQAKRKYTSFLSSFKRMILLVDKTILKDLNLPALIPYVFSTTYVHTSLTHQSLELVCIANIECVLSY